MSTEEFQQLVTPHKDSANVHTVNKAVHYHAEAHRQNRADFVEMLEGMARKAIANKDWRPLKLRLAGYW